MSKGLKRSRGYLHYGIRDRELGFFSVVDIYAEATVVQKRGQPAQASELCYYTVSWFHK